MKEYKTQTIEEFLSQGGKITSVPPETYVKKLKWKSGHTKPKKSNKGKQLSLFKKPKKY